MTVTDQSIPSSDKIAEIDYKKLYNGSPINFVNKETSPHFLYCYNCKKTTLVKKVGSFKQMIRSWVAKKESSITTQDTNKVFKCKECSEFYNIKLFKPHAGDSKTSMASSLNDKKIILKKKIEVIGSKAKESCNKIYSSVKNTSKRILTKYLGFYNK